MCRCAGGRGLHPLVGGSRAAFRSRHVGNAYVARREPRASQTYGTPAPAIAGAGTSSSWKVWRNLRLVPEILVQLETLSVERCRVLRGSRNALAPDAFSRQIRSSRAGSTPRPGCLRRAPDLTARLRAGRLLVRDIIFHPLVIREVACEPPAEIADRRVIFRVPQPCYVVGAAGEHIPAIGREGYPVHAVDTCPPPRPPV